MKRKFFLLATFVACLFTAHAENNAIEVTSEKGVSATFVLSNRPTVVYTGDAIIVESPKDNVVLEFSLDEKFQVTFCEANATDVIDSPKGSIPQFRIDEAGFTASGLQPNTPVSIYTVGGMLISTTATDNEGHVQVSLDNSHSGLYIIKSSTTTFKIKK